MTTPKRKPYQVLLVEQLSKMDIKEAIADALATCPSHTKAAEKLGVARTTLLRWMKEYGIS